MNVRTFLITNFQSSVLADRRNRLFHDVALGSQTAAMFGVSRCESRHYVEPFKKLPVLLRIVGAVAQNLLGKRVVFPVRQQAQRNGRQGWQKHGHIVLVGGADLACQRDAGRINQHMMFAAIFASIGRIRPGIYPPKTARTLDESIAARDQSSLSVLSSRSKNVAWILSQVPSACQSRRRRQQDIPDPQFSSAGRSSQAMPVLSTNKIPINACLSESRGRPPSGLASRVVRIGSIIAQTSSGNSGLAMIGIPFPERKVRSCHIPSDETRFC
jgi:hypothetical protein